MPDEQPNRSITLIDIKDDTRLHQSDYSARRVAYELGETIADATARVSGEKAGMTRPARC
jgi:hypothetical protein